ncbi:SCO family protein [Paraflavisolibacter sp. H34]|uniref:SCO family protein n=1 Tax=Huijunlia imazamoxiresistens TaxID=3127457 RepID=UPI0030168BBC
MNKTAIYSLLVALFLPLISYFIIKQYTSNKPLVPRHFIYDSVSNRTEKGKIITDTFWHKLPDMEFTNQLGQKVSWKDMEGKTVVIDFFFTRCPTICPRLTENMKMLQDEIRSSDKVGNRDPGFLQLLSISIDPERDSVPQLKKWADRFQINPDHWWLLTGDKKATYDLSLNHMKLALLDGGKIDTSFVHTDYMVLVDKNRNIRGYYHGLDTTRVKELARDIVFLTLERDPKRKSVFAGQLEMLAIVFLLTLVGMGTMMYFLKKYKKG